MQQRVSLKAKITVNASFSKDRCACGVGVNGQTIVILNLFQDNTRGWCVILKQVQDDDLEVMQRGDLAVMQRCRAMT
jgi:hypothetical protein